MKKWSAILIAVLLASALAGRNTDTLNVAFERTMLTLDTYATSERLALIVAHNVGDTLIHRNSETNEFEPHIATDWEFVSPLELVLNLRDDVLFHNGELLTAEDVAATLNWVVGEGAGLAGTGTLQWIDHVDVLGTHQVSITAKALTPTAIETLALIGVIYPASIIGREGGATELGQHPVGTGPYRFVGSGNNQLRFERFDDYFVGAKKLPEIEHLVIHTLPEEASRIASLLTGDIDIVRSGAISPDQQRALGNRARPEAADILRTWFVQFDGTGSSGVDYFTDVRVRQAVAHAINKDEIVNVLLSGYGRVIHTPCNPVQYGCQEDAAVQYEYNPAKARELLTEAGYPDGFTVEVYGYRDEQVVQAVQGYLEAVGIKTNLNWYGGQYDVVAQILAAGDIPLYVGSWGSSSVYDASAAMNIHLEIGGEFTTATNEVIDQAVRAALQTVDLNERLELYATAIQESTSNVYTFPLYAGRVLAGVSNEVEWQPSPDEIERYYLATWR
ncbi:MAG: ABC transporter substrate-binding protein [Trueperaceae bacterium]